MSAINTFIVDDSAVVRQVLGTQLANDPNINVIGVAPDPVYALEKMKKQWPDVIVLLRVGVAVFGSEIVPG